MQQWLGKISLRELRLLLIGFAAVLTAGVASLTVLPKLKELRMAVNSVQLLEEAAVPGGDLQQRIEILQAGIADRQAELYGDMGNMPVNEVEAYIIGRLQKISWRNDIELVSVEPAPGDKVEIFHELLFKVELQGEYANLYHWLWEARNELGFIVVKEYGMTRRDMEDDRPQLLASISLASYRVEP